MDKWEELKKWLVPQRNAVLVNQPYNTVLDKMGEIENPKILVDREYLELIKKQYFSFCYNKVEHDKILFDTEGYLKGIK